MKRLLILVTVLTFLGLVSSAALAQGNPRGTAKLKLGGTSILVEYGRPSLKGRTPDQLFGQVSAGEVWRLGADKSTTFSTSGDLAFGDVTVPKGEYSLWTRKEADNSWKLVFNKQHGQWGTQHDGAQDVAAAPLKVEKGEANEKPAEVLTVELENEHGAGEISIHWGDTELSATFKAK